MDRYIESESEAEEKILEFPELRILRDVPSWNASIYAEFQEGSVEYTENLFKPSLLDVVCSFLYYDKVRRHILRDLLRTSVMARTKLFSNREMKPMYVTGARELAWWISTNGHSAWLWSEETEEGFFVDAPPPHWERFRWDYSGRRPCRMQGTEDTRS